MSRYYQPKKDELKDGLNLEVYFEQENSWTPFVYNHGQHKDNNIGDLRVKYVDSEDFNVLGYECRKEKLGEEKVIIDFDENGEEVYEKRDIFNEESLTIIRSGSAVGKFMPWQPYDNIEYDDKIQTVKNLTELRKILK
jgi:hypothetical protein